MTTKLIALLAACAAFSVVACAPEADEAVTEQESNLGAEPRSAGITEGSLEEEGVLLLANDRAADADVLASRAGLPPAVARGIAGFRLDAAGKPRWFASLDEVDALPGTDDAVFKKLLADARTSGYVEAPDFDEPRVALRIPENLGRRPTAADIVVEGGFDQKTPNEVVEIVRGRIWNTVARENESFTREQIRDTHKAFTLAINNLWAPGSPHAIFAFRLRAEKLSVLGTMSAVSMTYLVAEKDGRTTYYKRGDAGTYEETTKPYAPVIMRAKVRLGGRDITGMPTGWGVRVFYPAWKAKQLEKPIAAVIEE